MAEQTTKANATETAAQVALSTDDERIAALLSLVHEIEDLGALGALAGWDEQTAQPEGAAEVRGHQMAALQGVLHERRTNPRLAEALAAVEEVVAGAGYTDADRGLARETRRQVDQARKLPHGLVVELAEVGSEAFHAWTKAKNKRDFAIFAPWLERITALQREVADRLGSGGNRYDTLLDLYEPGITTEKLDALFGPIRAASVEIQRRIRERHGKIPDVPSIAGDFPAEQQMRASEDILRHMGYDFSRGVLARSEHPFTTGIGSPFDVRVTVHPHQDFLQSALMAAIHEGGHGVYEQGVSPTLARTPVGGGASMGTHESQSRLWENAIGRSEPFWQGVYAQVQALFPEALKAVDLATWVRALNAVEPGYIRIEADEVTYNLHIIIRYELEKALINGDVSVESLPRVWNEKYQEYLGLTPRHAAEGVLQDVHWSSGFGYFPSYTLGNLYAAQIYAALRRAFPDFDARLAGGDARFILDWLREHMYVYGGIYEPETLIEKVTGEKPNPAYFARYLTEKAERFYDLTPA